MDCWKISVILADNIIGLPLLILTEKGSNQLEIKSIRNTCLNLDKFYMRLGQPDLFYNVNPQMIGILRIKNIYCIILCQLYFPAAGIIKGNNPRPAGDGKEKAR